MGWDGGPEVSVASNWRDRSERKEMQTTGAGPGDGGLMSILSTTGGSEDV